MRGWVRVVIACVGTVLLAAAIVVATFVAWFVPFPETPDYPPPQSAREAHLQDLATLATVATYDRAFKENATQGAFLRYIEDLRSRIDDMSPAHFELAVAGAVALADNAHSNVSPIGRSRRVNHLPLRISSFDDGLFVVQARREHADLLGAQLVAIDGHAADRVVETFVPYFGGPERRSRFFSPLFLGSPEMLFAAGVGAHTDRSQLTLRMANGEVTTRTFAALRATGEREPFGRELLEYRAFNADPEWIALKAGAQPPLSLQDPDAPWLHANLDGSGAYVRINYNQDIDGRSLTGWLDDVTDRLRAQPPTFAVIDLRFNGGGTNATSRFAARLPDLVSADGAIYVVISTETFSAGITAAAEIKKSAGDRTLIVGTPVGDRLRFVANGGELLILPNSNIQIPLWSAVEDYEQGCWSWRTCFWMSPFFMTEGVGTLEPDLHVPLRFQDYRNGRDVMLDAVLDHVRGERTTSAGTGTPHS